MGPGGAASEVSSIVEAFPAAGVLDQSIPLNRICFSSHGMGVLSRNVDTGVTVTRCE